MAKAIPHHHYSCSICAKNRSKKHQMFKKWDDFQNRPFCKGFSACKGYSVCKMVSLGQKLKMPKTCQKPLYKNIRVVLCKKPFEKTPNIREMRRFWKPASLQSLEAMQRTLCKMMSFGQKLKILKTCQKTLYRNIRFVLCKKPFEKNTKYSRNETILKIGHLAKAIAHAKAKAFPNRQSGCKIKNAKNMSKIILQEL